MQRRSSFEGDLDSRSAIETALRQSCTTFEVSVVRSRTTGYVLYLEAGKDFVDALFSFLLLPVGTIIHMLSIGVPQVKHYGAISSIFKSVEKLDRSLLHVDKNCILAQPRPAANNPAGLCKATTSTGLLSLCQDADAKRQSPPKKRLVLPERFYKCDNCNSISSEIAHRCYICWPENMRYPNVKGRCDCRDGPYYLSADDIERQNAYVSEQEPVEEFNLSSGPGFVKENIAFMVTDKLEIMPSTTTETMSVLNALKVASLADLETKKITVTITQVLQLLQSALTSNSCLNEVFGIGQTSRIPGETSSLEIQDAIVQFQGLVIPRDIQY